MCWKLLVSECAMTNETIWSKGHPPPKKSSRIAQWVKALASDNDLELESTLWKERTNFRKLFTDLYTPPSTPTQINE